MGYRDKKRGVCGRKSEEFVPLVSDYLNMRDITLE
jgi:hypothetical protein